MEIKLPSKLAKEIIAEPERYKFEVVKNNIVLILDNVPTNITFAFPQSVNKIRYIKSYKISEDTITVKTVNI